MDVWSHCTDHLWDSPGGRAWAFWWQRRRCHRWKCWALCRSTCAMGGGPQTSVCSWWTVEVSSWWSLKHTTTLQFAADKQCRYHLKHTSSLALSSWGVTMLKAETTNPQNVGSWDMMAKSEIRSHAEHCQIYCRFPVALQERKNTTHLCMKQEKYKPNTQKRWLL